jgi:hypothetical protein
MTSFSRARLGREHRRAEYVNYSVPRFYGGSKSMHACTVGCEAERGRVLPAFHIHDIGMLPCVQRMPLA